MSGTLRMQVSGLLCFVCATAMDDLNDYSDDKNELTGCPGYIRICKNCKDEVELFPGMDAIIRLIKENERFYDTVEKIGNSSYKWPRGVCRELLQEINAERLKIWDAI